MMQRVILPVLVAAALLAGAWLLWSRAARPPAPAPQPTPTFSPIVAAPTPTRPASRFRLSGTAVGDPTSYAAIEAPDGSSHLYRSDETVPGLGRIAAIHTDRVILVDPAGESLVLALQPAPTPTREQRRVSGVLATPTASPARDDTPRGSPSSDVRDRPAS